MTKGRGINLAFLEPDAMQIQSNNLVNLGKSEASLHLLENHKHSQK